jgi:flagellar basal-body rod modification protein FlgD
MSSSVNPVTTPNTSPDVERQRTDPLANESTFLTLLVSQMQNQDPLDPVDSNQFVTQLTQYSQLEQLIGIHKDTTNLTEVTGEVAGGAQ